MPISSPSTFGPRLPCRRPRLALPDRVELERIRQLGHQRRLGLQCVIWLVQGYASMVQDGRGDQRPGYSCNVAAQPLPGDGVAADAGVVMHGSFLVDFAFVPSFYP